MLDMTRSKRLQGHHPCAQTFSVEEIGPDSKEHMGKAKADKRLHQTEVSAEQGTQQQHEEVASDSARPANQIAGQRLCWLILTGRMWNHQKDKPLGMSGEAIPIG